GGHCRLRDCLQPSLLPLFHFLPEARKACSETRGAHLERGAVMSVDSIDDLSTDNSFARLPGQFYTRLNTQPLDRPRLLHANVSVRSEEHTSELQSRENLVCRL